MAIGFVILIVLSLVIGLVIAARRHKASELNRRAAYITGYTFPTELHTHLAARHPRLTRAQLDQVLEGLRQYFLACLVANRKGSIARHVGMPSMAVDDAWHEFILMTREYGEFCRHAFGSYLHHTSKDRMDEPINDAVANTLHQLKGLPSGATLATVGGIPLLFAMDRELGLVDGYRYDATALEEVEMRRKGLAVQTGDGGGASVSFGGTGSCDAGSGGCDGGGGSCGGGGGGCGS